MTTLDFYPNPLDLNKYKFPSSSLNNALQYLNQDFWNMPYAYNSLKYYIQESTDKMQETANALLKRAEGIQLDLTNMTKVREILIPEDYDPPKYKGLSGNGTTMNDDNRKLEELSKVRTLQLH